jgi:hypothetical protein
MVQLYEPSFARSSIRFDQTPSARVKRLRKEARGTPPGVRRDELLRRVQQIENISPAQEPLASLDLQPPK